MRNEAFKTSAKHGHDLHIAFVCIQMLEPYRLKFDGMLTAMIELPGKQILIAKVQDEAG